MRDERQARDVVISREIAQATAEILVMRERERIRRAREYDHPVNRAGRALGGLWRSIASGGWE